MYCVTVQFIGGYGHYGFDYCASNDFDTYKDAYNSVRRWRSKIIRENIEADITIKRI